MKTRMAVLCSLALAFRAETRVAPRDVAANADCITTTSGGRARTLSCTLSHSVSENTATNSASERRFLTEPRCSGRTMTIDVAIGMRGCGASTYHFSAEPFEIVVCGGVPDRDYRADLSKNPADTAAHLLHPALHRP